MTSVTTLPSISCNLITTVGSTDAARRSAAVGTIGFSAFVTLAGDGAKRARPCHPRTSYYRHSPLHVSGTYLLNAASTSYLLQGDYAISSVCLCATFGGDPVPDTDSGSLFHVPHRCRIGILGDLLAFLIQSPANFHDTWRND